MAGGVGGGGGHRAGVGPGGSGGAGGPGRDQDDADFGAVGAVGVLLDASDDAGAGGADEAVADGRLVPVLGAAEAGRRVAHTLGLLALPVGGAGLGLGELVAELGGLGTGSSQGGGRLEPLGVAGCHAVGVGLGRGEALAERDRVVGGRDGLGLGGVEVGFGLGHVELGVDDGGRGEDGDRVADGHVVALGDEELGRLAGLVGKRDAADFGAGDVLRRVALRLAFGEEQPERDGPRLHDEPREAQPLQVREGGKLEGQALVRARDRVEPEVVGRNAGGLCDRDLAAEEVADGLAVGAARDERFEVGQDAAREIDLATGDRHVLAPVGEHAVGLEVGAVGRAERVDVADLVADEERVGARRPDGLEGSFEAAEVLGVGRLDLDGNEVAVGRPIEEVADGGGGIRLDAADEALVAVHLDEGEGDREADEGDAEEGIDAAAGGRAVGRLDAVVVREHAPDVAPRPKDADALARPGVEERVGDVADDEGGVEVGVPGPDERERGGGDGGLEGVAVGERAVAEPALDPFRQRGECAADGAPERIDVGGRGGGRRDDEARGGPRELEEGGGGGVAEDAAGDVGAESHGHGVGCADLSVPGTGYVGGWRRRESGGAESSKRTGRPGLARRRWRRTVVGSASGVKGRGRASRPKRCASAGSWTTNPVGERRTVRGGRATASSGT